MGELNVPIYVQPASGSTSLQRQPIRIGIPLPCAALAANACLELLDSDGNIVPHQAKVQSRWPDGSIRWILLDAVLVCDGRSAENYALVTATTGGEPVREIEEQRLDDPGRRVRCGAVTYGVSGVDFPIIEHVLIGEREVLGQDGIGLVLTDRKGVRVPGQVRKCRVVDDGPVRTTLVMEGGFASDSNTSSLEFRTTVSLFSEYDGVSIEVDLHNPQAAWHPGNLWDLGDPGSVLFIDLSLVVSLADSISGGTYSTGHGGALEHEIEELPWKLYQDSSGGTNWNSTNHIDAEGKLTVSFKGFQVHAGQDSGASQQGDRAQPTLNVRTGNTQFSVAVEAFWQNFPKGLRCDKQSISVGLFPSESTAQHELQGGERKTHRVWIVPGASSSDSCIDIAHQPFNVYVDPSWVQKTTVIPCFSPMGSSDTAPYWKYVRSIVDGPNSFFEKRELVDEYGWRHFGDLYADHEAVGSDLDRPLVSHYNNQYDFILAAATHYLRDGDPHWRDLMLAAARHTIDIDIYHTTRDRLAYNGGMFWHTDHYKDAATATHRTYSRYNGQRNYGGGPSNEHVYTSGLLLYYFLTGDASAKEAVVKLADWVLALDDGEKSIFGLIDMSPTGKASSTASPDYHKPGRGAGNSINVLLDSYMLTGSRHYLEKAEALLVRCIHPRDIVEALELQEPEARWSYLAFLQVVGKYMQTKAELGEVDYYFFYARDSLLTYADWMRENEVPYKDVLHKVDISTETWPAQDIRKSHVFHLAARCSTGERRANFGERAEFFFQRCLEDLLTFDTAYLARPLVILAAYGHIPLFYKEMGYEDRLGDTFVRHHGYDFGDPQLFVPQRAGLRARLGKRLAVFKTEVCCLLRSHPRVSWILTKLRRD